MYKFRQPTRIIKYVVEYEGDVVGTVNKNNFSKAFILDDNYAVILVEKGKEQELFDSTKEIIYVDRNFIFTLNDISPIDAANITKFHTNPYLNLTGRGVLVGILDTGVDYLNTEFINEDDTTRVVSIWDQTDNKGPSPVGIPYGTVYTREQINEAINEKKQNKDPYLKVPVVDSVGHGTKMAGIIGAKGKNPELVGAAPECEFVVVKLLPDNNESIMEKCGYIVDKGPTYDSAEILTGIKYLYNVAKELNKPMVIYIPVGSNGGPHDGNTVLERYIDSISQVRGLVVVTGLGNQGDTDTHTTGVFEKNGDIRVIEIKSAPLQRCLTFEIWCKKPDKVSIGITSPSGENIEKIPAKLKEQEQINLVFEGSKIFIEYFLPEELTGDELIRVRIENIREGIWQFKLVGDLIVDGRFDAWLPQRPLIENDTRFLNPTPNTTLGTPSTSRAILTCGFYNQSSNSLVVESARGYTRDGRIVPNLACGGVNAKTTSPGEAVVTASGSSVASAVYAGACALLFQWGVVDGNDTTLYAPKMKTYLIRGASRRKGDTYPNPEWGYGTLNLQGVFENIRSLDISKSAFNSNEDGNLFVRIPKEIYELLKI